MASDAGSKANVASVHGGGPVGAAAAGDAGSGEPGAAVTGDAVETALPRDAVGPGSPAQAATRTQPRIAGAMRLMPGTIGAKTPHEVVWFTSRPFR